MFILTLSHTPGLLSWPALLQTFVLVASPMLGLRHMSTKDVDLQFIVVRLLHEVSKRKESESTENVKLFNKTHKANEKLCFYYKTPQHFVRNCLRKKLMRKKRQTKLVNIKNKCLLSPWVLMIIQCMIGSSIMAQHNT